MRHSYSRTALYKTCPRKYWFERVRNWAPEGYNIHLGFGTAYHEGIETLWREYYAGVEVEEAIARGVKAFHQAWQKEGLPEGEELLELDLKAKRPEIGEAVIRAYGETRQGWMDKFDLLGTEVWFEIPVGTLPTGEDLTYCGYIDILTQDTGTGEIHPIDIKTTTQGGEKGLYSRFMQEFDQSSQMEGYAYRNWKKYGDEAGRVYVDVSLIHLPAVRSKWDGRHFTVIPVDPDRDKLEEWLRTQKRWSLSIWEAEEMAKRGMELDFAYPKNTESCVSKYGPCPFLNVCRFGGDPRRWEVPPTGFVEKVQVDRDEHPEREVRNG